VKRREIVTEHPGEDFTGGELDESVPDDLADETRRPDELPGPGSRSETGSDPDELPEVPEPPD
jgi:hypothetical protein